MDSLDRILNSIQKASMISFTDDELVPWASNHSRALHITLNNVVVRAFNGTRREVLGDIQLELEIRLSKFGVNFQVIEIEPTYTMLLGRPWIHVVGVVSSTFHQKLKFVNNKWVITVHNDESLPVTQPCSLP
ncbi:hypothetical protein L6164_023951 [Bauhinia variegata]|uniref:Uncharacterized protein n=1 Tax=Bauhinia variegata TaxID=167791 RepID=A0ACB9LWB2_BAUVA|nr:hypothetical protein L6164_023951 [Bauhinia variegata]